MLNHVRTLLVNRHIPSTDPGSELIDAGFRPINMPTYLQVIHRLMFGAAPDGVMLNYQVKRLLSCLHGSTLAQYALKLDSRITYEPFSFRFPSALFVPSVVQGSSTVGELRTNGIPAAPDASGRMKHEALVEVTDTNEVSVTYWDNKNSKSISSITMSEDVSTSFPIGVSGYHGRVTTNTIGSTWTFFVLNRPTRTPTDLLVAASNVGEPILFSLFGVRPTGDYADFYSAWRSELPVERVAGLILAFAWRMEEERLNAGS